MEIPASKWQSMRPKARLIHTLGRDLISSEKVALIELVKNSYDADASIVVISFTGPLEAGQGSIMVFDDGHGMDEQTVTGTWFEIATPHRKKHSRTQARKRRVLGEKGIGRLAASRLGETMTLVTRKARGDEVCVYVDWSDFDDEDRFLDEVDIRWHSRAPETFCQGGTALADMVRVGYDGRVKNHGTRIEIDSLTNAWSRNDLLELRMSLSRLLPPAVPSNELDPDFTIVLDLPTEYEDLSGEIGSPPELDKSHYRLYGHINAEGEAEFQYSSYDGQADTIKLQMVGHEKKVPLCGPLGIDLRVWDRDSEALKDLLPDASIRAVRQLLSDASGISVYRDGFRVLPYGERGDDWLSMDARRVQNPTLRLSNNQVLGYVFITSDSNSALRDQSNREGLIDGPAFSDLRNLVTSALEQVEIRRYKNRRTENKKKTNGLFANFNLDEVREVATRRHSNDRQLFRAIESTETKIGEGLRDVQEVVAQYSRLAALGMMIDRVLHDGRTAISRLRSLSRFALRDVANPELSEKEKNDLIVEAFEKSKNQIELLRTVFKRLEPFGGRRRGRPTEVSLLSIVKDSADVLRSEANESGIEIVVSGEDTLVRTDPSEIQQVVVNLLNNAIYWTKYAPSNAKPEICINIERMSEGVGILISDSGPGVNPDVAGLIFDPYFSERPNGVGLGLDIVGNIVENYYGGVLELLENGPLPGATFRATLRNRI